MSSELAAVEEVIGRTWAIQVSFPDTMPRMASARETLQPIRDKALKGPITPQEVDVAAEELQSLRGFLSSVMEDYPETKGEFEPCIKTINYLIEPVNKNC